MNMSNFKYSSYYFKALKLLVVLLLTCKSVVGQDKGIQETVSVPEPLMFDLVRGLGARQGELEINALGEIPLNNGADRGVDQK